VSPNPEPDPLVWLVGGPGGSGLLIANAAVSLGLNANREIIFVDQRGTLNSNPLLSCPEIDTYMAASIGLAPGAPRPGTVDVAAVNACHARLVAEGNELADFDTAQNAADIADLRTALGIKEWNLYGVSYGSYLALSILRDHPTGIRSVVLDGVVPTNANLINDSWPNAAREYQAIIDACDAQPPCKAAYPHLKTEFIKTINRLTRHPLTVTVPALTGSATTKVVFDGYQLANLVVALSVDKSGADLAEVPAMIDALAHGNGTLAATALQNHAATPPGIVGYGLQWGFFCREEVAFTSPTKMLSAAKRALPGFPTATLRLIPQLPRAFGDCRVWDVRRSPHVHAIVTSKIPSY
jgi:pimeloyl-ACP methyl ester carboxylesterase